MRRSQKRTVKNKKKRFRWFIRIVSAFIGLGCIILLAVYISAATLSSGAIPIVPKPSTLHSPAPIPPPDLLVMEGEPEEWGEDVADPEPLEEEKPIYQQISIDQNVFTILIVGRDIRPGEEGRGRSDIMMVFSYNREEKKAGMVSLMRDSWVPIEGYDWNRLNAAYALGGVGLSINTINNVFDLDIQNYITLDFEAMIDLVDQIGGIDVPIIEAEASYYNTNYTWGIDAGIRHLDGNMALIHARNRSSNGADFERVRRQQDILLAIYQTLQSSKDPVAFSKFLSYVLSSVKTNMSPDQLFSLAMEIMGENELEINRGRVPIDGTWQYARMGEMSVLSLNLEKNEEYIHSLIYEEE